MTSTEQDLLHELAHLEGVNKKLSEDLAQKTVRLEEVTAKGEMYDRAVARADQLDREREDLQRQTLILSVTLKVRVPAS